MNDEGLNVENENENESNTENDSNNEQVDYDIETLNELAENFEFTDLQTTESDVPENNNLLTINESFNYNLVFLGLLLILLVSNLVKE